MHIFGGYSHFQTVDIDGMFADFAASEVNILMVTKISKESMIFYHKTPMFIACHRATPLVDIHYFFRSLRLSLSLVS
jgi:hypothetical protein